MRRENGFLLIMLIGINLTWLSCSNQVELPSIDCTSSDLAIVVDSKISSDCGEPGSITVVATGGTGGYQYSTDGLSFQSSATLEGLFAGDYIIEVKDSDGCTASVFTTLDPAEGSVSITLGSTDSTCGGTSGTITVTATGGVGPYTYALENGPFQTSNIFTAVSNGPKRISVSDSEDCETNMSIVVASGISLAADIMPIISSNCAITGCHNGSRSPDLRTTAGIVNSADRIMFRTQARTMPPSDRENFPQSDIDKIACWVEDGAPNN